MFIQKHEDVPLTKHYVMVYTESENKIPSFANKSTRHREIISFSLQLPYPLVTGWEAE